MNPVIVRDEPIHLAGLSTVLPPQSAPPDARPRVIQELVRTFLPKTVEIVNRRGAERYHVIENDVRETAAAPILRTMVAVESWEGLPSWCERFTIEPGRYAVFEHRGAPRDLSRTVTEIQLNWLSRIPGLFESDLEIMVYPPGYDPKDPGATFAYWLPLP